LHKIILIDGSIEAYRVAKRENIIYHIGEFDEAPSILYNAIIDYTSPENILEEKQRSGCDSVKALVVEDYEMNRILIEEMLISFKVSTDFALNGRDAVDMARDGSYDIIFMDINMPIMNGIDATKILRDEGVDTPIIALTANALEGDRDKVSNSGYG